MFPPVFRPAGEPGRVATSCGSTPQAEAAATFCTTIFPGAKLGVSWQVIPAALGSLLGDPDPEKDEAR